MFLFFVLLSSTCPSVFDQLSGCSVTCTETDAHVVSTLGREFKIRLSNSESSIGALTRSGICDRPARELHANEPPPQAVGFIANTGRLNQLALSASVEPLQTSVQLRVDYLRTIAPSVDVGPSLGYAFMAGEHYSRRLFWFSIVTAGLQLRARIAKVGPATFGVRGLVDFGYGSSDRTTASDADHNATDGWGEGGAFLGRARAEAVADVHLGRFVLQFAVFGGVVWEVSRESMGKREWRGVPTSAPNEPLVFATATFGARVGAAVAITKGMTLNLNAEVANADLVARNRYYAVTFTASVGPTFVF